MLPRTGLGSLSRNWNYDWVDALDAEDMLDVFLIFLTAPFWSAPGIAQAPAWPTKPVKIITGWTPGGNADAVSRLLAEQYAKRVAQTVIVENRPGAAGTIGAAAVARAEPDGNTRFRLLSDADVAMVPAQIATDREAAARAARRIGYPVVLKGVADHLPHKSELGLVRLHLSDDRAVVAAFDALHATLAQHARTGSRSYVVVQKMVEDGVELIVGIRNDPQLGSFVIVGPGGVLVDVANQASVRLGPVDEDEARAMLAETSAARLIMGVRGKGPFNMAAATRTIAAFSRFGAARLDTLATLEINPLIVGRDEALGVDVLAEPHARSGSA